MSFPALPPPDPAPEPDAAELADECVVLAARLVRAVRRRRPVEVARVLADVPDGRVDALAVVLAGMVPTGRHPGDLLAWSVDPASQPPSRVVEHGTNEGYVEHRLNGTRICRACAIAHTVTSRPKRCRDEFARLRALGVPLERAALLSRPAFLLAQPAATGGNS